MSGEEACGRSRLAGVWAVQRDQCAVQLTPSALHWQCARARRRAPSQEKSKFHQIALSDVFAIRFHDARSKRHDGNYNIHYTNCDSVSNSHTHAHAHQRTIQQSQPSQTPPTSNIHKGTVASLSTVSFLSNGHSSHYIKDTIYNSGHVDELNSQIDVLPRMNPEALGKSDYGFDVHYINKEANSVWRPAITHFRTHDRKQTTEWLMQLQEYHESAAAGRPRRLLVLINPVSGGSRGVQIYKKHGAPLFRLAGIHTDAVVTERVGHIKDILLEYDLDKIDGVCVVGGDGTFSEAAAGLLLRRLRDQQTNPHSASIRLPRLHTPIGVIPAGSGQGTCNIATGTYDITTAVLNIVSGGTFRMDAFTVHDDERFVSIGNLVCGFGLFSNCIEASEANRWLGRGRYAWGFVKTLSKLTRYNGEVYLHLNNGQTDEQSASEVSVNPECHVVKGSLLDIQFLPWDLCDMSQEPGVMYVSVMRAPPGLKTRSVVRHLYRMGRQDAEMWDFDFIERYKASMYRILLDRSKRPVLVSKDCINDTSTKIPNMVNIDGDAFPVSGSILQVVTNADVLMVYGSRHKWKSLFR